jgi:hypothetical protein
VPGVRRTAQSRFSIDCRVATVWLSAVCPPAQRLTCTAAIGIYLVQLGGRRATGRTFARGPSNRRNRRNQTGPTCCWVRSRRCVGASCGAWKSKWRPELLDLADLALPLRLHVLVSRIRGSYTSLVFVCARAQAAGASSCCVVS